MLINRLDSSTQMQSHFSEGKIGVKNKDVQFIWQKKKIGHLSMEYIHWKVTKHDTLNQSEADIEKENDAFIRNNIHDQIIQGFPCKSRLWAQLYAL